MKFYHLIFGSLSVIVGLYSIIRRNHPSRRQKILWGKELIEKRTYKTFYVIFSILIILIGINLIAKGIFDPNSGYFFVRFR